MNTQRSVNRIVIAVPFLFLVIFAMMPVLTALKISVAEMVVGAPPYTPLFKTDPTGVSVTVTPSNFRLLAEDSLYWRAYVSSLRIAAISTVLALLIGFPMAYAAARAPRTWRAVILLAIMLPFWTSFLIRVYAWIVLLRPGGILNSVLETIGVIDAPLRILNSEVAVYLGMVFCYLPFMVLPLYARLEKLDPSLIEAAADLGATPVVTFWRVTVPLALPGILAGCLLVFIPAVGEFVIPELLGGADTLMIGRVMWSEFFTNRDWPVSAAIAVVLLLVLVIPIAMAQSKTVSSERGS